MELLDGPDNAGWDPHAPKDTKEPLGAREGHAVRKSKKTAAAVRWRVPSPTPTRTSCPPKLAQEQIRAAEALLSETQSPTSDHSAPTP